MRSVIANLVGAVAALMAAAPAFAERCDDLVPQRISVSMERPINAMDLVRLRDLGDISLAPNGERLAFELRRADPASNSYCIAIFVMAVAPNQPMIKLDVASEPLTDRYTNFGLIDFPGGAWITNRARWSPDGRRIAYLKRVSGVDQLWLAEVDGKVASVAVASEVDVLDFAWMENSRALIFASRPGLVRFKAALNTEALRGFLYDERFAPGVSQTPMARDLPAEAGHVDVASGQLREATNSEASLLQIAAPPPAVGAPLWARSDNGDFAWLAPSSSSKAGLHAHVGGHDYSCTEGACGGRVTALWWRNTRTVQFLRREGSLGSRTALYRWALKDEKPDRMFATNDLIESCQAAAEEVFCLQEAATTPRRIIAISKATAKIRIVFDPNPEFQNIALQPAKRLYWTNNQGLEAYGDLILPVGHQPGQKHPLIVVGYNAARGFHRGGAGDEYPIQLFAANGFAVLSYARPTHVGTPTPNNEEGDSTPKHEAWADRRSVHSALEAGLDAAIATGTVDSAHVGITGLSDAAMTAQWALINSDRFAAASISSLNSRAGFLAIGGPARASYFRQSGLVGLPLEESIAFWSSASIAENPEKVNAPLLVQVADDELMSGVDSYEALRELNRPVELYVFPGEHHIKWQPAHRLALYLRNLQWFDFWLMGREDSSPIDPDQYQRWNAMKALMAEK